MIDGENGRYGVEKNNKNLKLILYNQKQHHSKL